MGIHLLNSAKDKTVLDIASISFFIRLGVRKRLVNSENLAVVEVVEKEGAPLPSASVDMPSPSVVESTVKGEISVELFDTSVTVSSGEQSPVQSRICIEDRD
ncbi:hypothetical protein ACOSQ4_023556 [Xanthoceras sorbifolium]